MTRTFARLSPLAVAAALCITLTACSSGATPAGPDPKSMNIDNIVESASEATYDPLEPVLTDSNGATAADLKAYLEDPDRNERFEKAVTAAGKRLALALEDGFFGETYSYTGFDDDPSYIGWSALTTKDSFYRETGTASTAPFIWVWWDHGSIDHNYPVTNLSLPAKGSPNDTNVVFAGPVEGMNYWSVVRYVDDVSISSFASVDLVTTQGWTVPSGAPNTYFPQSLEEYKQFDDAALAQLEANMLSWELSE